MKPWHGTLQLWTGTEGTPFLRRLLRTAILGSGHRLDVGFLSLCPPPASVGRA